MLIAIILLAILTFLFWLAFHITGAVLSALIWVCFKLPVALILWVFGLLLCITIILIPIGWKVLKAGFAILG